VPDFYKLVAQFSPRRLAHFCRVLALLLFEPEDRLVMDNSQVQGQGQGRVCSLIALSIA
jgi:hypothetical protein